MILHSNKFQENYFFAEHYNHITIAVQRFIETFNLWLKESIPYCEKTECNLDGKFSLQDYLSALSTIEKLEFGRTW